MRVFLAKGISLCFTCKHCSDECGFVKSNGTDLPEYITKTQKKRINATYADDVLHIVRACKKYEPDADCVINCKYCGEDYVLQAQHTKKIDGGFCYNCHVDRKKTYYIEQPSRKGVQPPLPSKKRKCPICGTMFMPTTRASKYCSDECRAVGAAHAVRKSLKRSKQRKKDKKLQQKWEIDNETARINKQAENLVLTVGKEYKQNIKETKELYQTKYSEFRTEIREKTKLFKEQWEESLAKALETLEQQYNKDLEDIEAEKKYLIEKAKAEITGGQKQCKKSQSQTKDTKNS